MKPIKPIKPVRRRVKVYTDLLRYSRLLPFGRSIILLLLLASAALFSICWNEEASDQGEQSSDQGEQSFDQGEQLPAQGEQLPAQGEQLPAQGIGENGSDLLGIFRLMEQLGYGGPQKECLPKAEAAAQPSIVVILIDDAHYSDFSAYPGGGYGLISTPWIDSIAQNGVRFTNGYVASPVCSPSRAALLTGRPFWQNGVRRNIYTQEKDNRDYSNAGLPQSEKTIAEYMQENGYTTAFFGKWHLGWAEQFRPEDNGFERYWYLSHGSAGYFPPYVLYDVLPVSNLEKTVEERLGAAGENLYLTDRLALEAVSFIDRHHKRNTNPFFLYLSFTAPHTPLHAKADTLERLSHIPDISSDTKKYLAMIIALDEAVGAIMSYLNREALCNDVLIVFVNDNGGPTISTANGESSIPNNEPLRGKKASYYEGGIRVPFMMQWLHGLPQGVVYDHPVITYDILPTAVAAAGGSIDGPAVSGVNLLPHLRGEREEPPHECLFWKNIYTSKTIKNVVRCAEWKLLYSNKDASDMMLYNLREDIGESSNLLPTDDAALNSKAEEMRAKMNAYLTETGY